MDPGEDSFTSLQPLKPADVLTSAVPHELAYRLQRLAERYREREEQTQLQKDLSLLLELTADYAESLDVEALLHDVTRRLALQLDISRASLVMLDPDSEEGVIVASSDDAALKDRRIELSRYPEIREVARTARPVVVENAPNHPLLEGVQGAMAAQGIQAIAALPLPIRGQVRGVLLVRASGVRHTFTAREIDFLTTVAHATAVALRNASVLETVRGQTEREKTARIAAEERAAALRTYHLFFANVGDGRGHPRRQGLRAQPQPRRRSAAGDARRAGAPQAPAAAHPDVGRGALDGHGDRRRPGRGPLQRGSAGAHGERAAADALAVRRASAGRRRWPPSCPSGT